MMDSIERFLGRLLSGRHGDEKELLARDPRWAHQPRLTLTMRPLTMAGLVLVLISGEDRRRTVERALASGEAEQFPVCAVLQSAPRVRILWTA